MGIDLRRKVVMSTAGMDSFEYIGPLVTTNIS